MADSLQYETIAYQLGLSTPGTGDPSDAKGDEWGKMNSKNGINIGVGSKSPAPNTPPRELIHPIPYREPEFPYLV